MTGLDVRPARILIASLSGMLAVLVGLGVWIAVEAREEQGRAGDKEAALLAAGAHAKNLISLDYRTVEADLRRLLETSTGAARAEYAATTDKVKSTAVGSKIVQQGVLRATGLVSLAGAKAKVLVVADVEIRWDGSKNPPEARYHRWSMDLDKVGGAWLVSKAVRVL
ncbi:Mce-associated membrane protein [Nonomuraea polychroma]|uniref:Mce-associated membrane protein n=1 Tax=Nonomuraea polychroma TaxID=46176 RepID=A0A438MMU4_9ACTN|nr:hypothetical protein [Nonomuraea polychroma]RVX47084.1 Mce-associated membrane protein [Nonomuraea polychroma]